MVSDIALNEAALVPGTHGALTGLPCATLVLERLEHAISAAARARATVAVLCVDVARRLRSATRSGDTLGRTSDDAFVVVCENLAGSASQVSNFVDVLSQRFTDALSLPGWHRDPAVAVSASIGAAIATAPCALGPHDLLREAGAVMDAAGRAGGGRLVISEPQWGVRLVPTQDQIETEDRSWSWGHSPLGTPTRR